MSVSIQDINSTIIDGQFTNDQLNSIVMAIKFARSQMGKQKIQAVRVGVQVKFVSSRTGNTVVGNVKKIGRKFVLVDTGITNWRVPASMLEIV